MTEHIPTSSSLYREYFQVVQAFNAANNDFQNSIENLDKQRQNDINIAINEHIAPAISSFGNVRLLGFLAGFIAICVFCYGITQSQNSSGQNQVAIAILIALGLGVVALILIIWSSQRIATLQKVKQDVLNFHPS